MVMAVRTAGWWNADAPYSMAMVAVQVTAHGAPLAGASVWSTGLDYKGRSAAVTGEDGTARLVVQFESTVSLRVMLAAGGDESARLEAATGEGRDYVTLGEFKSGAVGDVAVLGTHDVPAAAAPVVEAAGAAAAA